MGYKRALLFRWSRRDRLAALVVALSVAFLVGTALVILAAGSQTATIAAEFGSPGQVTLHESPAAARAVAGSEGLVLPFARASTPNGSRTLVVARPNGSPLATDLGLGGDGLTVGTVDQPTTVQLDGPAGSITAEARPRGQTALPPSWYLAPSETVNSLGESGAIAVTPNASAGGPGAPLLGALAFFLLGSREALTALGVAGAGAGVLVGVTVFGVTRIGVRDRLETIRIVRATGARPRTIVGLFAARAALLSAVGAALGYALGVILPNAAVSVVIAAGGTISLPLTVTERTVRLLVPILVAPVVVGGIAGAIAAYPAATRPPGRIEGPSVPGGGRSGGALLNALRPNLLDGRLVAPTAATLAAFVLLATVTAGLGTALAPITGDGASTVVEPGSPHPIASQLPETYADALSEQGIDASGEVLLLEVVDGRPFVAVGADYERFAAVHETRLTAGRPPDAPDEAVIGASLAATLDVDIGDELLLGGSTEPALAVVTVVGRYDADGPAASQLVLSLEGARHLAGLRPGVVHLISAERLPQPAAENGTVGVVDVTYPSPAAANSTLPVSVTVRNDGLAAAAETVTIRYRERSISREFELGPQQQRTVTVELTAGPVGSYTLHVDGTARTVSVVDPTGLVITGLPAAIPPGSRPLLRVETRAGDPVPNATVTVANRTAHTDAEGRARLTFDRPGDASVTAIAGDRRTSAATSVSTTAERTLDVSLAIQPSSPSVLVQPTARIELVNPWAEAVHRELRLTGPGTTHRTAIAVAPGARRTIDVPLPRQPAGDYSLTLNLNGTAVAETTYTVTGDDRLAAALASSGRDGGSGISRAIEAALGNLQLVIAVVIGLAGLMTVGATAATFAGGVQARRHTLGVHRATGAAPARIVRLVLADAARLGVVSTALGLVAGLAAVRLFVAADVLTILGIRVPAVPSAPVLLGIVAGAFALTLLGAGLATWGVLRTTPAALLAGPSGTDPATEVTDD